MMFSPHMPGDTEDDAKFIARACNSHYKLVNALTGLLPFHVSTEAQLPSEREAYRIAWKTEDDLADFVEWLKGRKAI